MEYEGENESAFHPNFAGGLGKSRNDATCTPVPVSEHFFNADALETEGFLQWPTVAICLD